ncbi:1-deoxy-D-xylulose-5-phosphate reductoisomerase, partial [Flavobacterium sp. SaA2.13]|nr:1-deoxy-D-xylulose-5-phosphate reductoisomerase [Flavobacterium sp. SaA2.13]
MKKKIAILGSTGSIGTTSLNIFKKNKNKFDIILLAANRNYSLICKQIKVFKPKYYIIRDELVFKKVKKKFKNKKIKIYNNFS